MARHQLWAVLSNNKQLLPLPPVKSPQKEHLRSSSTGRIGPRTATTSTTRNVSIAFSLMPQRTLTASQSMAGVAGRAAGATTGGVGFERRGMTDGVRGRRCVSVTCV